MVARIRRVGGNRASRIHGESTAAQAETYCSTARRQGVKSGTRVEIHSWCPEEMSVMVWNALVMRLWHATTIYGLRSILSDGHIRILGDRYTRPPLVHSMGCVSLFDFGPTAGPCWLFREQYRNWGQWLTGEYRDKAMIWLELDQCLTVDQVIPAGEVRELAKQQPDKTVIPGVEAGHRGPVPLSSIKGALIFCSREHFERHEEVNKALLARAVELGKEHWRPDAMIEALLSGRKRALRPPKK